MQHAQLQPIPLREPQQDTKLQKVNSLLCQLQNNIQQQQYQLTKQDIKSLQRAIELTRQS